jgi:hypothetical protein
MREKIHALRGKNAERQRANAPIKLEKAQLF